MKDEGFRVNIGGNERIFKVVIGDTYIVVHKDLKFSIIH